MAEPAQATDLAAIDAALRLVDREVWIVTAADGEQRSGLVATWVSAASIDPARPMLLAALGLNHFTTQLVHNSGCFAAHLLRGEETELAWNFARDSGRQRDKLEGLACSPRLTGSPVLADCLAWFDCRVFARHEALDRVLFWADVVAGGKADDRTGNRPLREQAFFASLTAKQRRTLIVARDADVTLCRPVVERWRAAESS